MTTNLVRAWIDGGAFLGTFDTTPVESVAVIDNEMSKATFREWYARLDISHPERVDPILLRGMGSTFNITDAATRRRWVERLKVPRPQSWTACARSWTRRG